MGDFGNNFPILSSKLILHPQISSNHVKISKSLIFHFIQFNYSHSQYLKFAEIAREIICRDICVEALFLHYEIENDFTQIGGTSAKRVMRGKLQNKHFPKKGTKYKLERERTAQSKAESICAKFSAKNEDAVISKTEVCR